MYVSMSNISSPDEIIALSSTDNVPVTCFRPSLDRYEAGGEFYVIYSLIAVVGLIGNIILFMAYTFWARRVLGKRETAVFLMRSQNVWDMVACVFLILNIYTRVYEAQSTLEKHGQPHLRIFYSLRNLLIAVAMYHLALLSLDRMLAITHPSLSNDVWNANKAKLAVALVAGPMVVTDLSVRMFLLYYSDCKVVQQVEKIYTIIYGVSALLLVVTTYVCYILSLTGLWGLWRRENRRRAESQRRAYTWTKEPLMTVRMTDIPSGAQSANNAASADATGDSQEPTFKGFVRKAGTLFMSRQHWSAQKQLVLVLLTISLAHTASTVPLFLSNARIISFPGYTLYYFFYISCISNPIIYILSRKPLRQYIVCLCKTPRSAFKPPPRELSGGI